MGLIPTQRQSYLDEWREIALIEESKRGKAILSRYGSFPAVLYWRIRKRKLFKSSVAEKFMDDFISYYFSHAATVNTSPFSFSKIECLAELIPNPSSIRGLLKFHRFTVYNAIFFKLVIDILSYYYITTGTPLFKKYKEEVIPLAIAIYQVLPQYTVLKIYDDLSKYQTPSIAQTL